MMQIKKIGVLQTSKVVAVLYLLLALVIMLPIGLIALAVAPTRLGAPELAIVFLAPLLYAGIGFVITAIACALYNLVAGWVGGIEIDIGPAASAPAPSTGPLQQPQ